MTHGLKRSSLLAACAILMPASLLAQDGDKTVELENKDGRKISAELLEKSKDKLKFRMANRVYTMALSDLSEASAEMVRNADLPQMADFELSGDFDKATKTHKSHRDVMESDGETRRIYSSYRTDTISGKLTVTNRDNEDDSPAGQLHVVVLIRNGSKITPVQREVMQVAAIKPFGKLEFQTKKASYWHSERNTPIPRPTGPPGKYYGYIAAVVVGGRIMEVKSVPSNYERDLESAKEMLNIGN